MIERLHENRIDPYAVLGVEREATPAHIRVAYLQKVREHTPERDPEGFKRVREAYEVLRSPRKRAEMTLLELRHGPEEFDLDRLRDAPLPSLPGRYFEHLLAIVAADVDAEVDAEVARSREAASGSGGPGGDRC